MDKEIFLIKNKVLIKMVDIENVIDRMRNESNDFVIPEYQRDYVWNENSVDKLFLSLYKGYPIGTMLIQLTPTGKTKLLDGLQRTFSLIKIKDKPFNFITKELLDFHFDDTKINESCKKYILDKVKEFNEADEKIEAENLYNGIDIEKGDGFEKKEIIKEFANDLKDWIEYDFLNIKIPQITLTTEFSDYQSSEVFELINSEGKGLNKYEVLSSYWSNFPIKVNNIAFIENFINERVHKYLESISSSVDKESYLKSKIEMSISSLSPANFIYAVFNECIKKAPSLKNVFYKKGNLRQKALEPIMSIFVNYLGIENIEFKNLKTIGLELSKKIVDKKSVDELIKSIGNSMSVVASGIPILNFVSKNGQNEDLFEVFGISISLITSMINTVLKSTQSEAENISKNFMDWLIIDTINKEYGNSSNSKAWKNFNSNRYKVKPKDKIIDVILGHLDKEFNDDTVSSKVSSSTLMILSLLQYKTHKLDSIKLDLDHIIPKSVVTSRKLVGFNYLNTIGNLQLLDSDKNRKEKKDKILVDKRQYDYLFDKTSSIRMNDEFIKQYDHYLKSMKNEYYSLDENGEIKEKTVIRAKKKVNESVKKKKIDIDLFKNFYSLRYEKIKEVIKEKF